MGKLLRLKINISFLANPFYLYCIGFSLAIVIYQWKWSELYPELSFKLILFLILSFFPFIIAGYIFNKNKKQFPHFKPSSIKLNDKIFGIIIIIGIVNVLLMGYLPILDNSKNYRDFGVPFIDTLFNTLSIFFSVFFLHTYLGTKKKRLVLYIIIILLFQLLIFRRATIIWITISSVFIFLIYLKRIPLLLILIFVSILPICSYFFGLYGNKRSNVSKLMTLTNLGASDHFKNLGISHYHYMTYLYISSPVANLQENIGDDDGLTKIGDFKSFFFYSIIPKSLTMRLEKQLNLKPPECNTITPGLIVGTIFMVSYFTMGWLGILALLAFLFAFITVCLFVINKWNTFHSVTLSLLSTTTSFLIFDNFLIRFDVILMLFIYPVLFHYIYKQKMPLLSRE